MISLPVSKIVESSIVDLAMELDKGEFSFVLFSVDDWEFPIPPELIKNKVFKIHVAGWTRENSYVDENGIFAKVAFGDSENSKMIKFKEIVALFDSSDRLVFQRTYDPTEAEPETHTLSSVMESHAKGVERSMDIMKKNNPGLGGG